MKNTRKLVMLALFVALILLLGLTPIGLIPLGFINVTILCVPVVVGTILLGLKSGLLLGAAFGAVSFYSALVKPSALVATLMGASPVYVAVMSFLPRLLVPVTVWLIYSLFQKKNKQKTGVALGAVLGSLTNTVFYLGLMLLFYTMAGIDSTTVLGLIFGTGAIAGSSEAAVAAIISVPVVLALKKLNLGTKGSDD